LNDLLEGRGGENENSEKPDNKVSAADFPAISDIIEQTEEQREKSGGRVPEIQVSAGAGESAERSEKAEKSAEAETAESAESEKPQGALNAIKGKLKNSELLDKAVLKDMFFGTGDKDAGKRGVSVEGDEESEEQDDFDYLDEEDEVQELFDKSRKKRITADPKKDKKIFSTEYMITPEQAADGYELFYREFIKPKNVRFTIGFGIAAAVFLISGLVYPKSYLNWVLMLICLAVIGITWLNSSSARKEAVYSADAVKNDSYKLSFFNSRIVIEESELAGDRIYSYQPVMIRFEDIDLKVIDCGGLYVLIFKKDYIYTVPKSAMNEQMNEVFRRHLSNILGDDYREYTIKQDKQDKQSKFEKLKKHTKKASESGADADETERE
jgi:hypothetical protein